jgi:hypothetical protein
LFIQSPPGQQQQYQQMDTSQSSQQQSDLIKTNGTGDVKDPSLLSVDMYKVK